MTPDQIAAQLDAEHAARFAPVCVFDAPTFRPKDIARVCGVHDNSVTRHVQRITDFPATVDPKSYNLQWKRSQWPLVLLTFLRACPKARRNLANSLGLSVTDTPAEKLVWGVLGKFLGSRLNPATT